MANNRMYIKCRECGKRYMLAKYYPSTKWYCNGLTEKGLDTWFEKHQHDHVGTFFDEGPTWFCLDYESEDGQGGG